MINTSDANEYHAWKAADIGDEDTEAEFIPGVGIVGRHRIRHFLFGTDLDNPLLDDAEVEQFYPEDGYHPSSIPTHTYRQSLVKDTDKNAEEKLVDQVAPDHEHTFDHGIVNGFGFNRCVKCGIDQEEC